MLEMGLPQVHHALQGAIPVSRVRRALKDLKAERRVRMRRTAIQIRTTTTVLARDAIWAIDATHLGRDEESCAVQAEVVREVASTRTIGMTAGQAATGADVVHGLKDVVQERECYPLVLMSDNGSAYTSKELASWCEKHGVLHLFSLPHTPQHNAACEHGMYSLKLNAGLGKGCAIRNSAEALNRLRAARDRIDMNRPRKTRGWQTAREADQNNPHWSALVTREQVLKKATCELKKSLRHCNNQRERRRAQREAILSTLQRFSVIQRTRDGRPFNLH